MAILGLESFFSKYKQVRLFGSPLYKNILGAPLCSTTCLYEEEDGPFNTRFRDLETITYFYNLSPTAMPQLEKDDMAKFLVLMARGANKTSIGQQLDNLIEEGKNITHIVRSTEEYGGDTNYSVWREYLDAEIYEVEKDE